MLGSPARYRQGDQNKRDTVELQGFHAHDLILRNGAIKAGDLPITYSPLELLSNHLGQVEIGG
jgi:hypothetical protein